MGKEISWEIRERAEELYIVDGLTYEQVADATGVSVSQLKNWGVDGQWREKREEYRKALGEIKRNTVLLRKRLIAQALSSLDPQHVYAAARVENISIKQGTKEESMAPDIDRPKIFLEDMEFIAEVLQEIDPEGLKVFARNFEPIVNRFKERHEKTA